MTLFAGDLTTPQRASVWMSSPPTLPSPILSQLIASMSSLIYSKLNRARTYSQLFTRTFDGVGNMQLVLPDYPVTSVISVYNGQMLVPSSVLIAQGETQPQGTQSYYGYRFIPWNGEGPGINAVLDYIGGVFVGAQGVKVTYRAGYLVQNEGWVVPIGTPPTITVLQPEGVWCRDNGIVYASSGVALVPVASAPTVGQYIPPLDATPGLYTFNAADTEEALLISYSFIPAALEEACIQMVAERYSYRGRVGEISKSLGGQETMRYMRSGLPPEVMALIQDYISVVYPAIGSPL